jgi:hypothetical protein
MTDMRPVLIGMNNPVSSKPEHALVPYPPGCTGSRLLEMLKTRIPEVTRHQYLERFDRRNLVPHKVWDGLLAAKHADELFLSFFGTGRTIVLLGADTVKAFNIPRLLIHPQTIGGATWRQIPHPSGRNLWFNDEANRDLVACLLEDLYRGT